MIRILQGDCREVLKTLPEASVHCVVTSPPYWGLRDYGVDGQIGLEASPADFIGSLVEVFEEVRRVLMADGTLWLNLGDTYNGSRGGEQGAGGQMADRSVAAARCRVRGYTLDAGLKPKDLVGIPWRVALALQEAGWWLRQDIIWHKPNPMPESVTDRCTKAHEYIFLLAKSDRYYYDQDAISEPHGYDWLETRKVYEIKGNNDRNDGGQPPQSAKEQRNKRSVWTVTTKPFSEAHFATFPPDLIEPCILAGCPEGGTVLDPFGGAGTTGLVADRLQRNAVLIELNPQYAGMAKRRIVGDAPLFADVQT